MVGKSVEVSDIEICGDEVNQQGIRFCIFQLHQTLHTAKYGAVFGAKGLTGEAYNGNTFWDSEVCCLPFYLFNNPQAAKSFLKFRYDTLPEAKERAAALDCKGAFYPIATISGRECCDLWQHASLQLQASTGVAYGLWNYVHQTGDTEFLYTCGAEMLVEISRMLASRGDFDPVTGKYGYYCVMGPDEFQMMVHHNAYTNFMGQKTLRYTLETLAQMDEASLAKLNVTPEEMADWKHKADSMYIPYDEDTKLFEQHMGYFHLPELDIAAIPADQFPLYSHWSYERIYRNSMIKQPDVLMLLMLYGSEFTQEQLAANYDFYEPRCIHESSLSPSIHSILACRLGRMQKAEDYFACHPHGSGRLQPQYLRRSAHHVHRRRVDEHCLRFRRSELRRRPAEPVPLHPRPVEAVQLHHPDRRKRPAGHRVSGKVTLERLSGAPVTLGLYGEKVTVADAPLVHVREA